MANKKIPKKATKTNKILQAVLACLLVVIIGGSVILGVGFGLYGKDTAKWFKSAPKAQTEQVVDEKPGDEQPGDAQPGENEHPGTNDPVVDPDPQIEYAIKVGDVLNTIYFNTNAAPDFSKINFDAADIMLNVGTEEQPTLIPEVKLATLGTITVDDAEHELALMALRVNAADMGESSDRIQYLIAVGFAGDLEMVNPIYSITNDGEGGWAMPSLNLVEFLELEDEEIIASALKVSALYHQDFWGDLIDAEAFEAFMPLETLTALYFNTDAAPDFSKLDWSNAKSYQGIPVLPLITIKDGDHEAAFVSVFKASGMDERHIYMDERHIYMDEAYMIFVGEDLSTNGWIYASEDVFDNGIVGWVKQLVKFDDEAKDIYKVYNIEFLKSFASKEPFEGVDYANPLIAEGEQVTTLYFNTNETPDFEKLEWGKATSLMNFSQNGVSLTYDGLSLVKGDGFHIYAVKSEVSGSTDENLPNGINYDIIMSQGDMVVIGYIKALYSSNMGWRNSNVNVVEFNQDYSSDEYRTIQNLSEVAFWDSFIDDQQFEGVDYNA